MYIMIILSFNFIITYVKEMVYVDYTSMMDNFMGGKLVGYKSWDYPLVNIQKAIENCHRNSGFTH